MKALVLVAGYGTRLYPLTLNKPKCLLEVGKRTILDRLIDNIAEVKTVDEVYVISNKRFYPDFLKWSKGRYFDRKMHVLDDGTASNETRLGALGDIELAIDSGRIADDLLIIFGDNVFDFSLAKFLDFAASKKELDAALSLYEVASLEMAKKYGIVSLGENQKIVEFTEKPKSPNSRLASAGIYYLPRKSIKLFREYIELGLPKDPPGNFIAWIVSNYNVYGFAFEGRWYDIGDKESLKKADEEYKKR